MFLLIISILWESESFALIISVSRQFAYYSPLLSLALPNYKGGAHSPNHPDRYLIDLSSSIETTTC
jgi:hypothetical protein